MNMMRNMMMKIMMMMMMNIFRRGPFGTTALYSAFLIFGVRIFGHESRLKLIVGTPPLSHLWLT